MLFRSDLHKMFDERSLVFVPKRRTLHKMTTLPTESPMSGFAEQVAMTTANRANPGDAGSSLGPAQQLAVYVLVPSLAN